MHGNRLGVAVDRYTRGMRDYFVPVLNGPSYLRHLFQYGYMEYYLTIHTVCFTTSVDASPDFLARLWT